MIRAGRLRHRIKIEQFTETVDSLGSPIQAWSTRYDGVPASVEPLSGRELWQAQAVNPETTTKITMRWLDGVIASDRIVFNGQNYDIHQVLPDPTFRRMLVIHAASGVNSG